MNGDTFVIYTTEQGGLFKVTRSTEGEYREGIERGQWDETPNDFDLPRWSRPVALKFIALLRVEQNHDFILGGDRDSPETWSEKQRPVKAAWPQ